MPHFHHVHTTVHELLTDHKLTEDSLSTTEMSAMGDADVAQQQDERKRYGDNFFQLYKYTDLKRKGFTSFRSGFTRF